jgi:hypothetical protein
MLQIIPPSAGRKIEAMWSMLVPNESVGEISSGFTAIFRRYVALAMLTAFML